MEKKKSIFKRWWFWVIVVLVIAGIGAVGGGEDGSEPNTAEQASTEQQKEAETQPKKTEKKSEPAEPENKPTISKAEFDAIKTGMTYEEVVEIIGSEGEVRSETGEAGSEFHTIMYSWDGEGIGANATLMFQGGKLQSKSQFGLE